jgi:hypothetical protein
MRGATQEVDVVAARARTVGEEHEVELRGLGGLSKLHVVPEVAARIGRCMRMTPRGDMMAGRIQKRAEAQVSATLTHDRRDSFEIGQARAGSRANGNGGTGPLSCAPRRAATKKSADRYARRD